MIIRIGFKLTDATVRMDTSSHHTVSHTDLGLGWVAGMVRASPRYTKVTG